MPDIKLFVCCHRLEQVPKHPLLYPIQVGAALADTRFRGFLHDDTGDNISMKNCSYCELTAQYWAWKNVEADYYGFFHYRRYLYPDLTAKRPYRIDAEPTAELLDRLGYRNFSALVESYDLITPKGENMCLPVREHYAQAKYHHGKDLALAKEIVRDLTPEYSGALEEYLSQSVCYFGNIYIMSRPIYNCYCAWLFSILEEFDRRADLTGYNPQELRVDGYLAERMLGVYRTYHQELKILELPRVHFAPETSDRWGKKILGAILPPGSRRRAFFKNTCK